MIKNILIIEDDEFIRSLLTKKLLLEDFSVSVAINGKMGLKKIKNEKPNLVLLDLILPDIDGFELLSEIKEDKATSSIPVIIFSNLGQKEEIEKGLKLGAVDYLIKAQFTPDETIDKIKKILEKN